MRTDCRGKTTFRATFLLSLVAAWTLIASTEFVAHAQGQPTKPISLNGLLYELQQIRGYTPQELTQIIRERGVDFEVTSDVERQLRQAGATSEVMEAARSNYRGTRVLPPAPKPTPPKPVPPTTLHVSCDLACEWALGGAMQGTLVQGSSTTVTVTPGQFVVWAHTIDGPDQFRTEIVANASRQTEVNVALKPIRDARLTKERTEIAGQAITLYEQKRYSEAEPLFGRACNDGDAASCNYLGSMYLNGTGVSKDEPRAVELYTKACDAGIPEGCNNLGDLYSHVSIGGSYDAANASRAKTLYVRACDAGNGAGCDSLGKMYRDGMFDINLGGAMIRMSGPDFPKDETKAATLFTKACEAANGAGCTDLGNMYVSGTVVSKDETRAVALYTKACDAGDGPGCSNLGSMYRDGSGVPKDIDNALLYLDKGCKMGNQWGCDRWKELHQPQPGMQELFDSAFDREINHNKYKEGIPSYETACRGGVNRACEHLGDMYNHGAFKGVPEDKFEANRWYAIGCDRGYAFSCVKLGENLHFGFGGRLDHSGAVARYKQACADPGATECSIVNDRCMNHGDQDACAALK
jgi:TPR repeat protein